MKTYCVLISMRIICQAELLINRAILTVPQPVRQNVLHIESRSLILLANILKESKHSNDTLDAFFID